MEKIFWIYLSMLLVPKYSGAQSYEAEQLLLDVQKLAQLKQMLADLKKGYDIVYNAYTSIQHIAEGNFNLHQAFLDGLLQVSPAVSNYYKVAEIVSLQVKIRSEYKSAFAAFRQNGKFSTGEIEYMGSVYAHLLDESIKNLEALALILSPGVLRMSDDERLQQVDVLQEDMTRKLAFLRWFNNQNLVLALQRTKAENEFDLLKKINGLHN